MGSTYCLIFLFAFFPAYITWNFEGNMPTADVQRISAHTLPVSEVKQKAIWNDPSYGSVHQPQYQGTHGNYDYHKEGLVEDSNVKSDLKDCLQTPTKRENQNNAINFKPSNSVPKHGFAGFGQPSAQYEFRKATNALTNVQPGSRQALVSSQSGSTVMRTLKVPDYLNPSGGESSYMANKVQTASSSYGPLLKGTPVYSSMNSRKPSQSGSSVVSSGPILLVRHGGYSGSPDSVKPLVSSHVVPYQGSQISRDGRLTASSQSKSWNKPLHYSMSGTRDSSNTDLGKPSKNDCKDNAAESIVSSREIILKAPESAQRNILPHYEATRPKFQQSYNIPNTQPNKLFKPMFPSQSGANTNVGSKPTIVSSGAILMQAPTDSLSRPESNTPKVYPSFPEREVAFISGQSSHQYKPFKVPQISRNTQSASGTYASSSQTVSSVKGTPYRPSSGSSKPSKSEFSATNPNIAGSNEINTVRVRLHKRPTSSFGQVQSQRAYGDISKGDFPSSSPPSYLGQKPSQNIQMPVSSSALQYHGSKGVQSQFVGTQGNAGVTRCITTIPSELGHGAIRRLSPTLSSNYRQGTQVLVERTLSNSRK